MSMLSNLKVLRAMFREENILYKHLSLRSYAFEMGGGESSLRSCEVVCHISSDLIQFYVYCPVKDRGRNRDKIIEYLARANYNLRVGNFEYDMENGEIRYKATLYTGRETTATVEQAMGVVTHAFGIMDVYGDGLMRLMFDPEASVEECFRASESRLQLNDILKPDDDEDSEDSGDDEEDGEVECFFGDDHLTVTLEELEDQDDEPDDDDCDDDCDDDDCDDDDCDDDDEEDEDEKERRRKHLREQLMKHLSEMSGEG